MITSLQLKGFKAWNNTGEIGLKPLTVFFGTNSSGKSSISQLLLLLKQTVESPDRKRVIHFGDRQSLVDVGTYQEMVFGHDTTQPIEFSFRWTLPSEMSVRDPRSDFVAKGNELGFRATVSQEKGKQGRVTLEEFEYTLESSGQVRMSARMQRAEKRSRYALSMTEYQPVRMKGRPWPLPEPVRFYGFPDEAVAYYDNTGFLPDFALAMERLLRSIHYLGPLRDRPNRTYIWSGEVPDHVGWSGDRVVEAILAAGDRMINKGYKSTYRPFGEVIARWLREMGLIEKFRVTPIARNRKEYEVKLRVTPSSPEVTLPDVGFGVSQVLPVIVQCFYASPRSIMILEQPEIHLHPSVQAGLADLFSEAVTAREDGRDRGIQLLVESHSEHFLRRLQRLIAEERLDPDLVAVYFCEEGREESKISQLEVDLFGRIDNWPKGFFGDLSGDVAAQTKSIIRRLGESESDVET